MITLIGHGPARLIAVSTTMAANTIASQRRYGRIRSRMKRDMLALFGAARRGRDCDCAALPDGPVGALAADGSGMCTALPVGGAAGNRGAARDGS